MNTPPALNGAIAANKVHHWLRAWYGADVPEAVDLEVDRRQHLERPLDAARERDEVRLAHLGRDLVEGKGDLQLDPEPSLCQQQHSLR